jgi:hypothetical protein
MQQQTALANVRPDGVLQFRPELLKTASFAAALKLTHDRLHPLGSDRVASVYAHRRP